MPASTIRHAAQNKLRLRPPSGWEAIHAARRSGCDPTAGMPAGGRD
ncbi:MAG: hypothetical protein ACSLE3_14415 [Microbacteriaceae bacterium]